MSVAKYFQPIFLSQPGKAKRGREKRKEERGKRILSDVHQSSSSMTTDPDQQSAKAANGPKVKPVERDDEAHQREAIELITSIGQRPGSSRETNSGRNKNDQHWAIARLVRTFWRRNISVVTSHEACRDHFGTWE